MPSIESADYRTATLAAYYPNHFVIRLLAESQFYAARDDQSIGIDNEYLSIYLHEYLHYWHNISTISGAKSLLWTHIVLAQVSAALLRGIDARGSLAFEASEKDAIRQLRRYRYLQDGDQSCVRAGPSARLQRVERVEERRETVQFPHGPVESRFVVLTVSTEGERGEVTTTYQFGALAIEEALALMFQARVEAGSTDRASDAPDFPYRVVNALLTHLLGVQPDIAACFALATLSLQSSFPGPALVEIATEFGRLLGQGVTPREAVERLADVARSLQSGLADAAIADLSEAVRQHRGRALMGEAFDYYLDAFRRAQGHRAQNPVFDAVELMNDDRARAGEWTRDLQLEFRACNTIQERPGPSSAVGRDFVVETDAGLGHAAFVLQCQQHFASVQASESQGVVVEAERKRCPLYTSCTLPMRETTPDTCMRRPWLRNTPGEKTCAYGVAVAALMGKLLSEPLGRPSP